MTFVWVGGREQGTARAKSAISVIRQTLPQKMYPSSNLSATNSFSCSLLCIKIERPAFREGLPMPRINFQQQLVALKDKLLAMAALSQQALSLSLEAYLTGDMSLCDHVKEIEAAINAAERDVDEMAYDLLAKEQPMAIDLRFILSVIKINGDLERIGDQATNI